MKLVQEKYKYFIINNISYDFIGFVNFFGFNKIKKQVEMGVIISSKEYRNKGIASTSIKIAIQYIFDNLNIDRIFIETSENNKPSLRLFEKPNLKKSHEYIEEDNFKFIVMDIQKNFY